MSQIFGIFPKKNGGAFYCVAAFSFYYRQVHFTGECQSQRGRCQCQDQLLVRWKRRLLLDELILVARVEVVGRNAGREAAPVERNVGLAAPVELGLERGRVDSLQRGSVRADR